MKKRWALIIHIMLHPYVPYRSDSKMGRKTNICLYGLDIYANQSNSCVNGIFGLKFYLVDIVLLMVVEALTG